MGERRKNNSPPSTAARLKSDIKKRPGKSAQYFTEGNNVGDDPIVVFE